jgi:type IV pilus assembly protein PilW
MHPISAFHLKQAGLSLIELMIAMLVGLILIAGVLSIFLSSRQSYGINSAVAQIQEHGRFALDFIRHDTRMAGYMGCGVSGVNFNNQLNSSTSLPYNFNNALTGYEYSGTAPTATYVIPGENPAPVPAGNWSPVLDASLPVAGAAYAIPGSDVLAMTMTQNAGNPIYITNIPSPTAAVFDVNAPGLATGDLMVISNCVNTLVLQVTNVTGGGTTISHNTGGAVTPGNSNKDVAQSFQGAQIGTGTAVAFFVGESADGSPALFSATTDPSKASGFDYQELVPGVENLQVLYGVDTTGSGTASEYDTADVVNANGYWGQVVSVRAALLLRSDTGAVTLPSAAVTYNLLGTVIQAPLDTRLRQVFTATIGIRNHLPNP